MGNTVYMVGTKESLKTNQWQAMCADEETAELYAAQHGLGVIKEVAVRPPRKRRGSK